MKKNGVIALGVSVMMTVAIAGLVACSSSGAAKVADAGATTASSDAATMKSQDWAATYPLQYDSYAVNKYKSSVLSAEDGFYLYEDGSVDFVASNTGLALESVGAKTLRPHGHFSTNIMESGPVARDEEGNLVLAGDGSYSVDYLDYDSENDVWIVDDSKWLDDINAAGYTKGCYACRSSAFDAAYEEHGAEVYAQEVDEEFMSQVDGQVWDCATCHEGDPGESAADAQLSLFTQVSRDAYNTFDAKERVCGQCHNTANYRRYITDQETLDTFDLYANGTDIEGLWKTELDQGIYDTDEDTGIKLGCFDEPELEMFQDSNHESLGLTCVDCHMPTVTDEETGETYTDHNASGSPLEKDASLELCLTCHKAQGVESADAMVKMVKGKQAELRVALGTALDRQDACYELIKAAVQGGTVDQAKLNQARDDYSLVYAYLYITNGDSNGRAVHNPDKANDYVSRANALMDDIEAVLA